MELITDSAGPEASLIDIGGGDSTLVDVLLDRGYRRVTVLDLSAAALERARTRLGSRGDAVTWLEGDATRANLPPAAFDLWHDRAVFHFLTSEEDRVRYVRTASLALKPSGTLIMATFALDGPSKCSGLPVERYDAAALARALGHDFILQRALGDTHRTPAGSEQRFLYAVFRRR
jgi:SAM-dependent methyltransferase